MNKPTSHSSLNEWLSYIENQHHSEIDLGLTRVAQVWQRLNQQLSPKQIITVAGTNGKGTTCACLEQLCLAHDATTAVYSSPHFIRYTERLRVNGVELEEQHHVNAFADVDQASGEIPLTYFEYSTLAGLLLAARAEVDFVILEVGLGGRLDAVNIIDPDIAVITTVDIDHVGFLGDNREDIGFEKAGILRSGVPFICGDFYPPQSVIAQADKLQCQAHYANRDFTYTQIDDKWQWKTDEHQLNELVQPNIPLQNASSALAVFHQLAITPQQEKINNGLARVALPGRMQQVQSSPSVYLDVAHNPQACRLLRDNIQRLTRAGQNEIPRVHAVVGMLQDKDIAANLIELEGVFEHFYLADLDVPRGASAQCLASFLPENAQATLFASVELAYDRALQYAKSGDLVIVFGSFFTVAAILENRSQ